MESTVGELVDEAGWVFVQAEPAHPHDQVWVGLHGRLELVVTSRTRRPEKRDLLNPDLFGLVSEGFEEALRAVTIPPEVVDVCIDEAHYWPSFA